MKEMMVHLDGEIWIYVKEFKEEFRIAPGAFKYSQLSKK